MFKLFKKDEKTEYIKYKKLDFLNLDDETLLEAASEWIYGKTMKTTGEGYDERIKRMPIPCQNIAAIEAFIYQVEAGGFNRYYFNEANVASVSVIDALKEIKAYDMAALVEKADEAYSIIESDLGNYRYTIADEFSEFCKKSPLNEFDRQYVKIYESDDIDKLLILYIKENIDCFGD